LERALQKQNEVTRKYSPHTLDPNFSEMKETFKVFEDEKSKTVESLFQRVPVFQTPIFESTSISAKRPWKEQPVKCPLQKLHFLFLEKGI